MPADLVSVATTYSDGVFVLAFRSVSHPNGVLILQCADALGAQDSSLGMDTYSISNGDGATVYGGITAVSVAGKLLTMRLSSEAAEVLGTDRELSLRLVD